MALDRSYHPVRGILWMLLTGNIKTSWQRLPWLKGSLLTLAIAAPWYVMAEIRTPGFWEYFFIGEHWNRFTVTGWAGDKYGTAHATQRGANRLELIELIGAVIATRPVAAWEVLLHQNDVPSKLQTCSQPAPRHQVWERE
jgi:4-amino-4-deoxy-L-arabinose transferase-like glycosyltransferase